MRPPLNHMRIRKDKIGNTFSAVRVKDDGSKYRHQGWDLEAPVGTPIYAIADGTIKVRDQGTVGYGKQIIHKFLHREQTLYAFYSHLSNSLRMDGDKVREGDLLGFTGKTGNARTLKKKDEEHLHFEIRTSPLPGGGLAGRIDPGQVLGFQVYTCHEPVMEPLSPKISVPNSSGIFGDGGAMDRWKKGRP